MKCLKAGVPQGSVLGPLLFLLYIINFYKNVLSEDFMFADDTSLFKQIRNNMHHAASIITKDLEAMYDWCKQWLVTVNPIKTVYMLFSSKMSPSLVPPILYCNIRLQQVFEHKHLGLIFTPNLSWSKHISAVIAKANRRLGVLKKNKYILSRKSLEIGYFSFICPILEYGDLIYDSCSKSVLKLENVQLEAARIATGCKSHTSHRQLYSELGWIKLSGRRESNKLKKLYCINRFKTPQYLIDTLEEMKTYHSHSTQAALTQSIPMPKCTIRSWNSPNPQCREAHAKSQFSTLIKTCMTARKDYFYTMFLGAHK